jgi:hypothetical protein
MIEGFMILNADSLKSPFSLSILCDGANVIKDQTNEQQNSLCGETIARCWNSESQSGQIIGNCGNKSVFWSHLACCGLNCSCGMITSKYLSTTENEDIRSFVDSNTAVLREFIPFPYLLVLQNQCEFVVVTSYSEGDFSVRTLPPAFYQIRLSFYLIA